MKFTNKGKLNQIVVIPTFDIAWRIKELIFILHGYVLE
jgi:hypothetical protein